MCTHREWTCDVCVSISLYVSVCLAVCVCVRTRPWISLSGLTVGTDAWPVCVFVCVYVSLSVCACPCGGGSIDHFAQIYAERLGIRADVLRRTLWGDWYLDAKNKVPPASVLMLASLMGLIAALRNTHTETHRDCSHTHIYIYIVVTQADA
jgi:hypothetical protein